MSASLYYVQCVAGNPNHIAEAVPGSALEARCKERVAAGYIDALCLGDDECPDCVEDSRQKDREDVEYLMMFGCPSAGLGGLCDDDCVVCKNRQVIADSPYTNQVRYAAVST